MAAPAPGRPPSSPDRVVRAFYSALRVPAVPLVAAWMASDERRRPALARLRPEIPETTGRPVWIHACSVGEVTVAIPLVNALARRAPQVPLLLSASTPTGIALARERAGVPVAWFPMDHPVSVHGFFKRVRPRALVILETELWPGVLTCAHRHRVPVALVNGRLSDSSAVLYKRFAAIWRGAVSPLAAAGMQTPVFAERLVALGANPDRVRVTGNIKFDSAPEPISGARRVELRKTLGIGPDASVLVFGSTRPGDEALLASCLPVLLDACPDLTVIVAPRHLDRLEDAEAVLSAWPTVRRTAIEGVVAAPGARIIVLDTLGELSELYGLADVAVVGGSFSGDVGGHNPIEPAAQGVATVFGPDMRNFPDIARVLLNADATVQATAQSLPGTIRDLLRDPVRRQSLVANALATVAQNAGALARTVEMLSPLLRDTGARAT